VTTQTTQQMFYERAVPVTPSRHGSWSLDTSAGYAFARNVNSVPLAATEFQQASVEYPIVFVPTQGGVVAAALLGPRAGENVYVDADGTWRANYVPAFMRRYPFAFAAGDDPKTLTLCIDEACGACNTEGRGERLFDAEGAPTAFLQGRLEFARDFQVQFDRTRALCRRLEELGLFQPKQAKVASDAAGSTELTGYFNVVAREKLKSLPDETLAQLVRSGELELVYLHLQSLRNLSNIGRGVLTAGAAGARP